MLAPGNYFFCIKNSVFFVRLQPVKMLHSAPLNVMSFSIWSDFCALVWTEIFCKSKDVWTFFFFSKRAGKYQYSKHLYRCRQGQMRQLLICKPTWNLDLQIFRRLCYYVQTSLFLNEYCLSHFKQNIVFNNSAV